jgi:hypothetical protein
MTPERRRDGRRRDRIVIRTVRWTAVAAAGDAHHTPDDDPRGDGGPVKLDKQELVRVLRTEGDNDTADKVESTLPDEVDTDRDGDALDSLGLDRTQLMAKLAGGGLGGTVAP